jgi:peroxiredoxin
MIAAGDEIPSVRVKLVSAGGATDADAKAVLSSGRVVFFTLPGAFTPTCSNNHLPGYVDLADRIRAKGVDRIVCGSVNDHHVIKAWAAAVHALPKIEFIADGNAELAKVMGLERDMSASTMGLRFIRAAIVVNNGKVEAVYTEDAPGQVTSSGAPAVLASL